MKLITFSSLVDAVIFYAKSYNQDAVIEFDSLRINPWNYFKDIIEGVGDLDMCEKAKIRAIKRKELRNE